MFSQFIKQSIQTSSYRINSFRIVVRSLCQIPAKEQEILKQNSTVTDKSIGEARYPGYEIIYKFPYVHVIALYNKAKLNMLIGAGLMIPTMCVLSTMDILSENMATVTSATALSTTITLYIVGLLCQNLIGIIYYKDDKSIKIAYVNFRGQRIDIDTSIDDIKSLTSCSPVITDKLYRTVHLESLKYPLKLLVRDGIIYDKERLSSILGDYE